MRKWLCKIICGNMGAANTAAERANSGQSSTVDLEAKIRDIRRRISEQNRRLDRYSTPGDTSKPKERSVTQKDLGTTSERASKNAEMNDLKAKLMGKKNENR